MITPGFSPTATERVLPKLALDFTTANLDARITFTRTTDATHPATYTNSSGIITSATNNQPRFDYDPVTLACNGLLIEESRTNLLTYSQSFSNAEWTLTEATISTASASSPFGTVSVDTIIPSTNNVAHIINSTSKAISGGVGAQSIYVKAAGYSKVGILEGATTAYWATFNLTNGTVIGSSGLTSRSIQNVGNGWYRITAVTSGASNQKMFIYPLNDAYTSGSPLTYTYAGNGTFGISIIGAQIEVGAFATSIIPTTSAALTRNADVATMTGTNFSDWWNNSEGTFVFSCYASPSTLTVRYLEALTGTNAVRFYNNTAGSNKIAFNVDNAGATQCLISANVTSGSIIKASGAFKANNFSAGLNGTLSGTDVSGLAPGAISTLYIGDANTGGRNICACMKSIYFYPLALTTAEVTAFSK